MAYEALANGRPVPAGEALGSEQSLRYWAWQAVRQAGVFLAFFFFAEIGSWLALENLNERVFLIWPAAGFALAVILGAGFRYLPVVLIANFLWFAFWWDQGPGYAATVTLGYGAALGVAALILRRGFDMRIALERIVDVGAFVLVGALLFGMLSATGGFAAAQFFPVPGTSVPGFEEIFWPWLLGDTMGVLIIASFGLVWSAHTKVNWDNRQVLEVLVWLFVLVTLGWVVFVNWAPTDTLKYPLELALFPILAWAAVRFGQRGATTGIMIIGIIALRESWWVLGPTQRFISQSPAFLWMFVGVISVTSLFIAAVMTEHRVREESAWAVGERLRAVLDALPDTGFVLSRAGIFLEVFAPAGSQGFEHAERFRGRSLTTVFNEGLCARFLTLIREVLDSQDVRSIEYTVTNSRGEQFTYEGRVAPFALEPGHYDRVVWLSYDITERKRAAAALEKRDRDLSAAKDAADRANRAKGEFLALMSHEIRTPMNAILGFADLLQRSELTEEQMEHLGIINRSGKGLLELINTLLDFSKIESQAIELESAPFKLEQTAMEALEMVLLKAQRKGVALDYQRTGDGTERFEGDPYRLRQILLNLLNNAVKFTDHGSVVLKVHVAPPASPTAASPPAHRITFAVEDTGIGISPQQRERLFKPFSQGDSSTTRKFGGTGLGLVICQRLVQKMGGDIQLQSTPGTGSVFSFSIHMPAATQAPAPETPAEPEPPFGPAFAAARPLDILVAEDDPINRQLAAAFLDKMGYTPTIVSNGVQAGHAIREHPFDLILADVQMPELDGLELTAALRAGAYGEDRRRSRIVAVTAHALPEDTARILAAGVDAVLTKPVESQLLQQELTRAHHAKAPAQAPAT